MTKPKKKEKPLTVDNVANAIKKVLSETLGYYLKKLDVSFDETNKKIDGLHEAMNEMLANQQVIINKLRDHERRLQELEKEFLEN